MDSSAFNRLPVGWLISWLAVFAIIGFVAVLWIAGKVVYWLWLHVRFA